jgi:RNase P subunit RPR2
MNEMNRPAFIDTLYSHQERQIKKYECVSCEQWFPGSQIDVFTIRDGGIEYDLMFCDECQAKKRHELLR